VYTGSFEYGKFNELKSLNQSPNSPLKTLVTVSTFSGVGSSRYQIKNAEKDT